MVLIGSHVSVVSPRFRTTGGCILVFRRQRGVKVTEKWKKNIYIYIYAFVFTWVDLLINLGPKQNFWVCFIIKKKDSLDSIPSPSPSMTIQIMDRKVGLRWDVKAKDCWAYKKVCWQQPATFGKKIKCSRLLEGDGMESRLPFKIFSTLKHILKLKLCRPIEIQFHSH